MPMARRLITLATAAAVLAACGKSQVPNELPLAFVPADTPYVYANTEPMPREVLDHSSKQMQAYWPVLFGVYDELLKNSKGLNERQQKIAAALLEEVRNRDTLDKFREIGFKPDGHMAFYGVGLTPVARLELSDPAAFKAMVARIEAKTGEKLATGKTGDQDYWQLGDEHLNLILAIENTQLVATIWAPSVGDGVKQTLLGLTKPGKSLATTDTFAALSKQYGYTPYGTGYIDVVGIVQRLSSAPTGTDLEIAKAMKLSTEGAITDPTCKTEILGIAQKFPRLVAGVETLTPMKVKVGAQVEIEPGLAKSLMAALTPAPGTGGAGQGLMDISLSVPVLKLKDFLVAQTDAAVAKPYACAQLADLNKSFAELKTSLDATIPPPFSDLTGMRFTLTRIEPHGATDIPDAAGKLLIGSSNPLAAIGMAQLAVPQLKDLKITTDKVPVAVPAGLLPAQVPALFVAASDKAIAMSVGKGEQTSLADYLSAPPASSPVFLRMYFTGALYGVMSQYMDLVKARLPAEKRGEFDQNAKMFEFYQKMLRTADFSFEANANGIGIHEAVESAE